MTVIAYTLTTVIQSLTVIAYILTTVILKCFLSGALSGSHGNQNKKKKFLNKIISETKWSEAETLQKYIVRSVLRASVQRGFSYCCHIPVWPTEYTKG